MEVTQTQRNPLTENADGVRSETIILHRLYSPSRLLLNRVKVLRKQRYKRYWNGYLGFTRVHGETRYNEAKNAEIADRKSM